MSARKPDPHDWQGWRKEFNQELGNSRKRYAAYKQGLKESLARDEARNARLYARLREKKSFTRQEIQAIEAELTHDYMGDLRQYRVITAVGTFLAMGIIVSPSGALCWWMEWWPIPGSGREAWKRQGGQGIV